ncbi:S8 family serine peptidase [Pseudarthrobacter sp. NPDC092439]|uniref:S8 family serine peptidase n=1 Tax=unclassified Pseudarthrobacter TaxID=2647000 RepID=UPI00381A7788
MKKLLIAGLTAAFVGLGATTLAAPGNAAPDPSHVAGQILVKFRDQALADGVLRQHGLRQGAFVGTTGAQVIKVPAGRELRLIDALSRNRAVEYAEPDAVVTAVTDDTYFERQYALRNDGRSFQNTLETFTVPAGTPDADVDAVEAWGLTTGRGIRVAILDTGVASDNPDISTQVVARANFSGTATGEDNYGHGTHVAGIVAAAHNSTGVAGVCPECDIVDVKVLNDSGSGSTSNIVRGIAWAASAKQGEGNARIINMSLGQRVSSRTLEEAVRNAWKAGVVIVAAAGNGGSQAKIYPGAYPDVIAVAATDNNDAKASFSSYGAKWVDVAAPGVSIYSTFPNHPFALQSNGRSEGYDIASGTSMASPVVAGVAALALSSHPNASNAGVRAIVESTADGTVAGTGSYWKYGRVNAYDAVRAP